MTLAFIFSDVGFGEWFVLLAVILVVVGPKRLPETARKFGAWYSKFRRAADSFKRQLLDMDTEFSRAVDEAERQTNEAFSMGDEAMPPGGESYQPQEPSPDQPPEQPLEQPPEQQPPVQPQESNDGAHQEP